MFFWVFLTVLIDVRIYADFTGQNLKITPAQLTIYDEEENIVTLNITIFENITSQFSASTVLATVADVSIADIISMEDDIIGYKSLNLAFKFSLKLRGRKIGHTFVIFNFTSRENASKFVTASSKLAVIRRTTIFDYILNYLLGFLIVISSFGFGCNLDYTVGKELVKSPKACLTGITCQFVILPIVSFILGWCFVIEKALAFGLLAMGCMPGGFIPLWSNHLIPVDITFGMCLTFISNILAFVMIPIWLLILGPLYMDKNTMVPLIDLTAFSLIPLIPILIGGGLKKCTRSQHRFLDFTAGSIRPFSAVLFLFCITFACIVNLDLLWNFVQDWRACLLAVALPWIGGFLSLLIALALRLSTIESTTIALEMLSVNTALAIVLLKNTLPQPEADMSSVIPTISFIFSQLPLIIVGMYHIGKHIFKTRTVISNENTRETLCDPELEMDNEACAAVVEHYEMEKIDDV